MAGVIFENGEMYKTVYFLRQFCFNNIFFSNRYICEHFSKQMVWNLIFVYGNYYFFFVLFKVCFSAIFLTRLFHVLTYLPEKNSD